MVCTNCGKKTEDGMRFCGYCGSPMRQKRVCPSCGCEIKEDMAYCGYCGTRAVYGQADNMNAGRPAAAYVSRPGTYTGSNINYTPSGNRSYQGGGAFKAMDVTWFVGKKRMGFSEASGEMKTYFDRLELKKKYGSTKATFFGGYAALALTACKVKNEAPVVFPMNQIMNVREGQYGFGIAKTMVLEMKNGEVHQFLGKEKDIQECIALVRANIC